MFLQPVERPDFQLPPSMADTAPPIDNAYMFIFWFSVVFFIVVNVAMIYFVIKYKRKKGVKPVEACLELLTASSCVSRWSSQSVWRELT